MSSLGLVALIVISVSTLVAVAAIVGMIVLLSRSKRRPHRSGNLL
jgi:hypothetical protein